MHKIYELKEMLCDELEEYGSHDKLDMNGLEVVDKLAHAIKNIDKIIESHEEENEYSSRYNDGYSRYNDGTSGRGYNRGGSCARGRGGSARRDSMGRYSRRGYAMDKDMVEELRTLMNESEDEQTRQEFQKLISKLEMM